MTQPTATLPDAAAQKAAAVEVFAQYEPPLYEAYLEMMLEWLAAVKVAMFAGGVATLGLVPDPLKVFSQTPKWTALTAQYTAKVAEEVLAAPYRDLFADGALFESRPFVRNWIAERENRLNAVPTEVFGLITHIVDAATVNGASIPDVAEQIERLFDDTSMPKWQSRARTVARTEVVGAYNGGLHDAFAMIVKNDPDTKWVKRWLATEDHRTRPDHREADGQVVPFSQPFDVGGFAMMYPHDPDGPPQEVINCRCTLLLEVEGEPTKMGNRQYKDGSLVAGFNPAEKRDHNGKWTKGSGLLKGLLKGSKKEALHTPTPEPSDPEPVTRNPLREVARTAKGGSKKADREVTGDAALKAFPSTEKASAEQRGFLEHYADNGFEQVNLALSDLEPGAPLTKLNETDPGIHGRWGGRKVPDLVPKTVTAMDSFMKPSTQATVLHRGIRNPKAAFGDLADGDMTGVEYVQKSYASTSSDPLWGMTFAGGKGGAILRIHAPAGTPGMRMTLHSDTSKDEKEVTLARGLRYRITGDSTDEHGNRILDVEVIGNG